MSEKNAIIYRKLDWWLIGTYLFLVLFGWLNIYSALYSEEHPFIFDLSQKFGMQFIWILLSLLLSVLIIFILNPKIYSVLSPLLYFGILLLLFAVIFLGKEINGSKSWFVIGPFSFQPAEVSKISTSLFLSYTMSKYGFKLNRIKDAIKIAFIILIPILLIIMEKETGSALVYTGLIFVLYREGLNGWFLAFGLAIIFLFVITLSFSPLTAFLSLLSVLIILKGFIQKRVIENIIGGAIFITLLSFLPQLINIIHIPFLKTIRPEYLALIITLPFVIATYIKSIKKRLIYMRYLILSFVFSVIFIFSSNIIFDKVLQPHQKARIENLLGIQQDLKGIGYNVHQSKIAIGSGGLFGKGFLNGTQTKFNFVPEQSTDFIFCTIGEEWGFLGCLIIIGLFVFLISRIIIIAERQKDNFVKIYGYCIAAIFFMHFFINIGMTIGLLPVIGIPLPFISYGGSSLLSFTILLFIFIRLDLERWQY
jgi:Bacterial cell division membrane protein